MDRFPIQSTEGRRMGTVKTNGDFAEELPAFSRMAAPVRAFSRIVSSHRMCAVQLSRPEDVGDDR